MKKALLIIYIVVVYAAPATAQGYAFRHLTTAEGLLSDLRLVMTEDRQGRLWIGSDEGINVFDGYQLTGYSIPDKSGLLHNNVQRIFCDKRGTVWIYTPRGIQFKKENDSRFRKLDTGQDSLNKTPPLFGETSDGRLVVIGGTNAWFINSELVISKARGLTSILRKYRGAICLERFRGDEWFIGTASKLVLLNIQQEQQLKELTYTAAWCVARVTDTTILAGSFVKDEVAMINLNTGASQAINGWPSSTEERMGGYAASIVPMGNNKYAIGCRYYGVYVADLTNKTLLQLTHDVSNPASLKSRFVRRIFVTREGTMFVHAKGISYTPLNTPQFNTVKFLIDGSGQKFDGGFNSFTEDKKGNFWIGTNDHLALWNRATGTCKLYPFYTPEGGPQKFKTVRAVVTDKLDRVWVGAFGGGLGLLQPDGSFEQYNRNADPQQSLPGPDVFSIGQDNDRNFIVCGNAGFAFFDPIAKKVDRFANNPKLKKLSGKLTNAAYVDKKNNWWLAQGDGIFYYDRQQDSVIKIKMPDDVKDNMVNTFCTDSSGNLYAGGWGGIYIIPRGSLTIQKHLTKEDGLFSNNVIHMLCDVDGNIWVIGNIGVARYDPTTGQLQTFDARDGMEQSNHPLGSGYVSPSGEMFIASSEGFNYFYPSTIKTGVKPIQVFVTSLELKDTVISIPSLNDRVFKYYQNNFSFTFQSVDFNLAPVIQYRYKLNGFDTAWVLAGKQRTARYTNLPANKYSFTVEASPNGKDWYACQQPLSFSIRKAFWQTWLFRILLASIIAGGIYMYYRNRLKQVNKEARLRCDYEIKLNELENSALRTQMNPHFIFNSLNTINSFINSNDRVQANQYISKFSKLVRLILDHSREKKIVLGDELEVAELYMQLEQIRFEQKFQYSIDIKGVDPSTTEVPPLIIQPFVENAILHGLLPKEGGGTLKVEISRNGELLQCFIEDNGIGREAAKKIKESSGFPRKSHGMEITLKRIELFNKDHGVHNNVRIIDLCDENGVAAGTRVEIPLSYQDSF